jgi:hypothetical protein
MVETLKKRKTVSLENKLEAIKLLDEGKSYREVASKLGLSLGTVQKANKRKKDLQKEEESLRSMKMVRLYGVTEINTILWRWFCAARSNGYPISGPILQGKALSIAEAFQAQFKASNGWLEKWKKRHNIKSYSICGESGNVDFRTAEEWKSNLVKLCEGYTPADIFNMDETGYFYRALPNSTLERVSKSCKGGNLAKDRITVALTCSALGEKLPPLVIGKSKNPRCFRNKDLSSLGITYNSSTKSWMTNTIFNKYLLNLNDYMCSRRRKIILFIDNAPVHIIDEDTNSRLSHVKVLFFPPNLTCLLQPLDAGIIRSVKAFSRKHQVLHLLESIDSGEHAANLAKKLQVIDAMKFIGTSWDNVKAETIQKCFRVCGFETVCEGEILLLPETVENEVEDLMGRIGEEDIHYVQDGVGEYAIPCSESLIEDLIAEYNDDGDNEDENENSEPHAMETISDDRIPEGFSITSREALLGLKAALRYVKEKGFFEHELPMLEIIDSIQKKANSKLIQPSIKSFFQRKE